MNSNCKKVAMAAGLVAALLAVAQAHSAGQGANPGEGKAPAMITVAVPADAEVFFDGNLTTQTGSERQYSSPGLEPGKAYVYTVSARWNEGGKPVEQTRRVKVTAGQRVLVSFQEKLAGAPSKEKEEQVVTSKASKLEAARRINFKKAFGLPFDSLGTLGSRIDAARRRPDPVALGHAASELAVAEKVSKKKASLTSTALLAEAAELARLRRQAAELKALFAIKQQIADEATDVAFWNKQIALADQNTAEEREAVLSNKLPSDAPRRVLLNNYTTQYIDLWVNGSYKMQVPPGGSKWCVIEHKWNPTVLTAWGDEDDGGPWRREIWGAYKTYTWNLE